MGPFLTVADPSWLEDTRFLRYLDSLHDAPAGVDPRVLARLERIEQHRDRLARRLRRAERRLEALRQNDRS